ncbi:MAG TPA: glycosyltransferase family 2 protein [Methanosarcina sp.]|nr:glycosyltransferase family 2 protein [Methanosarcina sp.]
MLNIVIPMAGAGSRFAKAGYSDPKPLIKVHQTEMILAVIRNLAPKDRDHRFIFIAQEEHIRRYHLNEKLSAWAPNSVVIAINGITEGAACTALFAKDLINTHDALMIANSDQYIDIDIEEYLNFGDENAFDGLIMTMKANDPKWSYVGLDDNKLVNNVVEKEVISDEATVGIYNFKHGRDFVRAAEQMIASNLRVNGEFYVAPTYNQLIQEQAKVGIFNIGSEANGMYGLGIPADLDLFLQNPLSHQFKASQK